MIQVILGSKGSGKTVKLLELANNAVGQERGNIIFIDHNNKHMYDLQREVRLVNAAEYAIDSPDSFYGMLCGMLSGNFDITLIVVDGFLKILDPSLKEGKYDEEGREGKVEIRNKVILLCRPEHIAEDCTRHKNPYSLFWRG